MFSEHVRESTLFHVPHAGTMIPSLAGYLVDRARLQQEIDLLTDHATDRIFDVGIEMLACPWSRVFCDVERLLDNEPMEATGMGWYYTKCDDGTPLREDSPALRELVFDYYRAHENALSSRVYRMIQDHGCCHIVDCHSFTSAPLKRDHDQCERSQDICIGTTDRNTPGYVVDHLRLAFEAAGLTVSVNRPYSGSIVPAGFAGDARLTSVMIEINRGIYMDGDVWNASAAKLNHILRSAFAFEDLR